MDELGFAEQFPELFGLAYRVAYGVLGPAGDGENVAQETLTRALLRWPRIRGHSRAWVTRVAMNLAIDSARRTARYPRTELIEPWVEAADVDRQMDLARALRRLSRRQRQVLACRYLAGLADERTAAELGISVGSVKQHAARALAALRGDQGLTGNREDYYA